MPIPEHTIDEILERVDLVALVGRHVELKKSGKSFKGRCPFHQEKSASFYVTPELKRFKCFGCQAGGDAIAFVQRYLGRRSWTRCGISPARWGWISAWPRIRRPRSGSTCAR